MAGKSLMSSFLGGIEWAGNKLPDPVFLFLSAALFVAALSGVGTWLGWSVQPLRPRVVMETATVDGVEVERPRTNASGRPVIELVPEGSPVRPRNLLSGDGVYWLAANMVRNFLNFPPLGVVVVGMFGIGVAEKFGLFAALMRWVASVAPARVLTPTIVLLGLVSNIASDAGYIVLPALAAGLYAAFGRHPLAGVAASFAGISGGFSANLMFGSTDTLVAGITETGARVLEPSYAVLPTCNWWFMIASTFLLTGLGWFVTDRIVEPRLRASGEPISSPTGESHGALTRTDERGLAWAGVSFVAAVLVVLGLILIPGAPLHGTVPAPAPAFGPVPAAASPAPGAFTPGSPMDAHTRPWPGTATIKPGYTLEAQGEDARGAFRVSRPATLEGSLLPPAAPAPRWSLAIVPIIFVVFLISGIVFGAATGVVRTTKDISTALIHCMVQTAPVITMAFVAAQFISSFQYSQLDRMLAYAGGKALLESGLPPSALLVGLIVLTMIVNLLMSSMSAKWTMLAPIIVPMMMMVGTSPELTQAAYRVGDSVTNILTPLNTYAIIIVAVMQRYQKSAGMGTMIAMMLPYSAVFAGFWTVLLLGWVQVGLPLGPGAPTWYVPTHAH